MAFERINTIVERMMDRLVDIDGVPNGPGMRLVPASSRQCPRAITAGKLPQLCPPMPHQWNREARISAGSYRGYQGGSSARISADDGGATVVRLRCPGNGRANRARNLN